MKNLPQKLTLALWATATSSLPVLAHEGGDPLLARVMIDQFEWRDGGDEADPYVLEAQAWIGKDLHKLWIKTDVERVDGETEEAEPLRVAEKGAVGTVDLLEVRSGFGDAHVILLNARLAGKAAAPAGALRSG